jgi:hypothetical protein
MNMTGDSEWRGLDLILSQHLNVPDQFANTDPPPLETF